MLNKVRIENNPYRVLGVYAGGPIAVEVKHLNQIRAFSKVGQPASFDMRGDEMLPPAVRTEDTAEAAAQVLSLPKDRVENSLLWFSNGTDDWGRVLNTAVQSLLEGDYTKAINNYEMLISDTSLRTAFIESVTHGLMTLSRDELAMMISDLISSCEDDMDGFWMSGGQKPSGEIAIILFEKTMSVKLSSLLDSIDFHQESGEDSSGKVGHSIDFYKSIDRFTDTLDKIIPIMDILEELCGKDSIAYKSRAEEVCGKAYEAGVYLIRKIGEFVWIQQPKYRLSDSSYKKYRSKMPVRGIRACMDLICRVDAVVNKTANAILTDDLSKIIRYSEIDSYQSTKGIEYVDRDDIIRRSVRSFMVKKGIAIAVWLAVIYLILQI